MFTNPNIFSALNEESDVPICSLRPLKWSVFLQLSYLASESSPSQLFRDWNDFRGFSNYFFRLSDSVAWLTTLAPHDHSSTTRRSVLAACMRSCKLFILYCANIITAVLLLPVAALGPGSEQRSCTSEKCTIINQFLQEWQFSVIGINEVLQLCSSLHEWATTTSSDW